MNGPAKRDRQCPDELFSSSCFLHISLLLHSPATGHDTHVCRGWPGPPLKRRSFSLGSSIPPIINAIAYSPFWRGLARLQLAPSILPSRPLAPLSFQSGAAGLSLGSARIDPVRERIVGSVLERLVVFACLMPSAGSCCGVCSSTSSNAVTSAAAVVITNGPSSRLRRHAFRIPSLYGADLATAHLGGGLGSLSHSLLASGRCPTHSLDWVWTALLTLSKTSAGLRGGMRKGQSVSGDGKEGHRKTERTTEKRLEPR
jgi:hypothetical protein